MIDCNDVFFCFKCRVAFLFWGAARAVVAKTPLNSGKSTIFGDLRVRFGPLGMTDGDDTGTVFSFPQVTRLLWFSLRDRIGWESPEWALQPPIIVDSPEFDPVFSTSRVESVCRGGFGAVLYRIRMRWRVLLEAPRHD